MAQRKLYDLSDPRDVELLRELAFESEEESEDEEMPFYDSDLAEEELEDDPPKKIMKAELSELQQAEPSDLQQAGPSGLQQAGPSGLQQAELFGSLQTMTTLMPLRRPSSSSEEDDNDEIEQELQGEPAPGRLEEMTWNEEVNRNDEPFPFDLEVGPVGNILEANEPVDYFEYFVDQEFAEMISRETNIYAEQEINKKRDSGKMRRESRDLAWKETNPNEIKLLLGLLFLQGIVQKPTNEMFFSRKPLLKTPIFYETMSHKRFFLLLKYLHFRNNEDFNPRTDNARIYKIQPVLNHLLAKFQECYVPDRDVSVDESLLLWKGRLSWKMYIPKKRARFGMESYRLCEAKTGYVWNILIYTGKDTELSPEVQGRDISECTKPTRIVLTLADNLLKKGYRLVVNNYYGSPELFNILSSLQTDGLGTTRINRKGLPAEVTKKKLARGETASALKGRLLCLKWHDKKDVTMLSTTHDNAMVEILDRRRQAKQKPQVVVDYNTNMGGVDLADQYLITYSISRKRLKNFYQKMFRHLIDVAMYNAFIIYRNRGGKLSHLDFRLSVINSLIEKYGDSTPKAILRRKVNPENPTRLSGRHFPQMIPTQPTTGRRRGQRRCVVCLRHKMDKKTTIFCPTCDVGLCVDPCFKNYHTLGNY